MMEVSLTDCCPLVVDTSSWVALLGGITMATYFLRSAVTTNIMGGRRLGASVLMQGGPKGLIGSLEEVPF